MNISAAKIDEESKGKAKKTTPKTSKFRKVRNTEDSSSDDSDMDLASKMKKNVKSNARLKRANTLKESSKAAESNKKSSPG